MKKILAFIRQWAWLAVAASVVTALGLGVRSCRLSMQYAAARQEFDLRLRVYEQELSRLAAEKSAWMTKAADALQKADALAETNALLMDGMAAKDRENDALRDKIKVLPAGEVVAQTRERLLTAEVDETPMGIRFTLAAARLNLARLYDADYFTLTKEPAYRAVIAGKDQEIGQLREAFSAEALALDAANQQVAALEQVKLAYADILKKSERQAKWLRFTIRGAGVAVGATALFLLFVR